uniref:Lengsin n=1 Tax=Macrostomum lignano TaxID=282301 RepID=A0A1I8F453_9PLAT
MDSKAEEFLRQCEALLLVRWVFPDLNGIARLKEIPGAMCRRFFKSGGRDCCSAVLSLACTSFAPEVQWIVDNGFPDCSMLAGSRLIPPGLLDGAASIGQVICSSAWHDGTPVQFDSRNAAKRQIERLAGHGLALYSAVELEWRLFIKPKEDVAEYTWHESRYEPLLLDIHQALQSAGLRVEALHTEFGCGQMEVTMAPKWGICGPDEGFLYRDIVRQNHGYIVFIHGVPCSGEAGSGLHFNQLALTRANAFFDAAQERKMSAVMRHWLARPDPPLGRHRRAYLADGELLSPIAPAVHAGLCRLGRALGSDANPGGSYIENRMPSSAANAYIVTGAATLAAGLDGLERQLTLPPKGSRGRRPPAEQHGGGAGGAGGRHESLSWLPLRGAAAAAAAAPPAAAAASVAAVQPDRQCVDEFAPFLGASHPLQAALGPLHLEAELAAAKPRTRVLLAAPAERDAALAGSARSLDTSAASSSLPQVSAGAAGFSTGASLVSAVVAETPSASSPAVPTLRPLLLLAFAVYRQLLLPLSRQLRHLLTERTNSAAAADALEPAGHPQLLGLLVPLPLLQLLALRPVAQAAQRAKHRRRRHRLLGAAAAVLVPPGRRPEHQAERAGSLLGRLLPTLRRLLCRRPVRQPAEADDSGQAGALTLLLLLLLLMRLLGWRRSCGAPWQRLGRLAGAAAAQPVRVEAALLAPAAEGVRPAEAGEQRPGVALGRQEAPRPGVPPQAGLVALADGAVRVVNARIVVVIFLIVRAVVVDARRRRGCSSGRSGRSRPTSSCCPTGPMRARGRCSRPLRRSQAGHNVPLAGSVDGPEAVHLRRRLPGLQPHEQAAGHRSFGRPSYHFIGVPVLREELVLRGPLHLFALDVLPIA